MVGQSDLGTDKLEQVLASRQVAKDVRGGGSPVREVVGDIDGIVETADRVYVERGLNNLANGGENIPILQSARAYVATSSPTYLSIASRMLTLDPDVTVLTPFGGCFLRTGRGFLSVAAVSPSS